MGSEPFRNRVWRCLGCSVMGSIVGAQLLVAGLLLAGTFRATLNPQMTATAGEWSTLIGAYITVVSLFVTLPCAILILLPIEMRLRHRFSTSPGTTTAAMVSLAAAGGALVACLLHVVQLSPGVGKGDWMEVVGAVIATLPFSTSSALMLSWLTCRAVRREDRATT